MGRGKDVSEIKNPSCSTDINNIHILINGDGKLLIVLIR